MAEAPIPTAAWLEQQPRDSYEATNAVSRAVLSTVQGLTEGKIDWHGRIFPQIKHTLSDTPLPDEEVVARYIRQNFTRELIAISKKAHWDMDDPRMVIISASYVQTGLLGKFLKDTTKREEVITILDDSLRDYSQNLFHTIPALQTFSPEDYKKYIKLLIDTPYLLQTSLSGNLNSKRRVAYYAALAEQDLQKAQSILDTLPQVRQAQQYNSAAIPARMRLRYARR